MYVPKRLPYDAAGNVLTMAVSGAAPSVTQYEYNELNQCVKTTDALGQTQTYAYDLTGNLMTTTDRDGIKTSYTYNAWNEPLSVKAEKGGQSQSVSYAYDVMGNRKQMTDSTGVTQYEYDFLGRLTREEKSGKIKTYSYTREGARSAFEIQAGNAVQYSQSYTYDNQQRLTQISCGGASVRYTYDENSRVAAKTAGGVESRYTYNASGNTTGMTVTEGGKPRVKAAYT